MIVESKSLCSNSKVMAKAPETCATNSHKRSNRKFGKQQLNGQRGTRIGRGVDRGVGRGIGSGNSQGGRQYILHAEGEAKRAQKIESALYIYAFCLLPLPADGEKGKTGKLQKTRYTHTHTNSQPKWKCDGNATVQKLKNNIFLGPHSRNAGER